MGTCVSPLCRPPFGQSASVRDAHRRAFPEGDSPGEPLPATDLARSVAGVSQDTASGTRSFGSIAPRLSAISKRPSRAWAMYMFMRTWC